jgi:KaiC/GvpD/RAD55 family RecA-like ATPase
MQRKIQLFESGIPLVDEEWKGLYCGGTYLLIGPHKSGKTLLCLQYAMETIRQNQVCLFFTSSKPKELMIQAASINIDIQSFMEKNQIIIIRVAPPSDSEILDSNSDDYLTKYLKDILTVVEQFKPAKNVFDELIHFVEFKDVDRLIDIFVDNCEKIENADIIIFYATSEPASSITQMIIDAIASKCTGVISLKKETEEMRSGEMIITPNIDQAEGQFKARYNIGPNKGVAMVGKKAGPTLAIIMNKNVA